VRACPICARRNRWEEERRRQVASERETRVSSMLARMNQRDEQAQEQAKVLASHKAEAAERRELRRRARDAKHAAAWEAMRQRRELRDGSVRDKVCAFEMLANRRREARKRQQEEAKRLQVELDTMKLELGFQRRAVERQRQHANGDPEALAALEHELAEAEVAFLRATARVKKASDGALLAQSQEDRQRVEEAVRDAALRTVARSTSSGGSFNSVNGLSFGGQRGYQLALARLISSKLP
jgi:signal recognition particle GTPase